MTARPLRPLVWFQALAILALGLAVYGPALRGGWIWDDVVEVTQNPVLRAPDAWSRIWLSPAGADYFPLKTSVQVLEWQAWGANPLGYHLVSLGLHLLSALLFWRLLSLLGLRLAWWGGLLLAVHPLAVESVAWIAELKNTLSLALLLAAMIAYVRFSGGEGRRCYWASLLFFLLALLGKTSVVMFPCVILLYVWWRRGRIGRQDLRDSAPFFALAATLGLVTVWFQHHRAIVAGHQFAGGPLTRVAAAGWALGFYLIKSVWPAGLLPVYPRWEIDPAAPLSYVPALALAVLLFWCWARRATWGRPALFGLGFFVLNVLPVSGLVDMAYLRISRVADHLAYVSLLGVIGLAVAAAGRIPPWPRRLILAAVVGVLAWQGRAYAAVFRDEETFWTYELVHNPRAWVAESNLGYALFQAGRVEEAIAHDRQALRLEPNYAEARYNLGTALLQINQVPAAIVEYEAALKLQPASAAMHNNVATALAESGRLPEAIPHLEEAVRLEPDYAEAHHNLGNAYLLSHRFPEAIREYGAALRLRPDDAAASSGLEMAEQALQSGGR